jgi:hypothetical protein
MKMQPMSGSSFEVIKPKLFLELLTGLLADSARLDRHGGWPVRDVVFALPAGATFADQPGLVAGHVLMTRVANTLRRPVSDPHTHSGEARARSTSSMAVSSLLRKACCSGGTRTFAMRTGSLVQHSGRNRHSPTAVGTSPRASVAETRVWRLAVLPRVAA